MPSSAISSQHHCPSLFNGHEVLFQVAMKFVDDDDDGGPSTESRVFVGIKRRNFFYISLMNKFIRYNRLQDRQETELKIIIQ